jgi:Carboxypeptidase regulatory-like domain
MSAIVGLRLALQGFAVVALIVALSVDSVLAQSGASTGLTGRVTDSSGAGIPGVTVTITNIDTGSERIVTTSTTGDWEARFLSPGTYRVTFELASFRPLRREGITVSTA